MRHLKIKGVSKLTKHTTQPDQEEYPCTREDLLDEYTREENVINQLRKIDDDTGLTQAVLELYTDKRKDLPISKTLIQYEESFYKRNKHLKWLSNVTNRDGSFRTLQDLVNNHDITEEELELFGGKDKKFPYREINQIHRVKLTDGTQWIVRIERWYGLTKSCAIVTCPVRLGYYLHPSHTNEFIQAEKDNPNLPTTRIVRVKPDAFGGVVGKRKYTDPYSEEKMRKYMRHSVGQFGLLDHISLIKENASNPIACRDIERAITGDFDTLFNEYSRVKPTVDIEEMSKKFAEALKKQTEKEADAAEHFQ